MGSNRWAIRFYEKYGFQGCINRKKYIAEEVLEYT